MNAVRRIALFVLALATIWTLWVLVSGGIEVTIGSTEFRSHDPFRPFLLAAVAAAVFLYAGGFASVRVAARRAKDLQRQTDTAAMSRNVVIALAVVTAIIGLKFGSTVAGGSDAYGYISEADLWLKGSLKVSQPFVKEVPWPSPAWTFSPLGYRPISDDGTLSPTYAAGLALMMAAVKKVAGHAALFWIVPICGALTIFATYGLGRRFGSPEMGAIAAGLVATSPPFLYMLVQPMTDVPVTAAWALAFYFLFARTTVGAALAGIAAAIAIMIRPNLALLCGALVLWLLIQFWQRRTDRRKIVFQLIAFIVCVTPGIVAVAFINRYLYGSPLRSGYGDLEGLFAWNHLLPNIKNYSSWFVTYQSPLAVLGLCALVLPVRRLWPTVADRSMVVVSALFVLGLIVEYCTYLVFDAWWYLRFLLAAWPFIMLGLGAVVMLAVRSHRVIVTVAASAILIVLMYRGVAISAKESTFDFWRAEAKYVGAGQMTGALTPANSVIFTMQHSGTVRYYGGRMSLRYDNLEDSWLDRAVSWLNDHGAHPYALLEDWELPDFMKRFGNQRAAERIQATPLAVYKGRATIYLYDLIHPDTQPPVETVVDTFTRARAVQPAPPPTLTFRSDRGLSR